MVIFIAEFLTKLPTEMYKSLAGHTNDWDPADRQFDIAGLDWKIVELFVRTKNKTCGKYLDRKGEWLLEQNLEKPQTFYSKMSCFKWAKITCEPGSTIIWENFLK